MCLLATADVGATEPAGALDRSFGKDGIVMTRVGDESTAFDVAVQADRKIVVSGDSLANDVPSFTLVRYRPNGTLDGTFGNGGRVTRSFDGTFASIAAIALQRDGKIVAVGVARSAFTLARFRSNGTLDSSFGYGGIVHTTIGGEAIARGVALQPDGKIVAVGQSTFDANVTTEIVVARYKANGALDNSFGSGGLVIQDFGPDESATSVVLDARRRIVVGGSVRVDENEDMQLAVARYLPDGTLDDSFDGDGLVRTSFGPDNSAANAVLVQPDGKILAAGSGSIGVPETGSDFALVRYLPDGSLDTSFGTQGIVAEDFGRAFEAAQDVQLQADGKIVVAGGGFEFVIARYLADGAEDTSFDGDGEVTLTFAPDRISTANGLAIQPHDGRIVVAGFAARSATANHLFTVARLHAGSSGEAP